jgi:Domain of unknown function (DUF4375)
MHNKSKPNFWIQIKQAFEEVNIYKTYEVFKRQASKYPEWKIELLAIHWTMSEVINGGLKQYFSNSAGILAPEAVLGFQRIGKPELAAILQKAMSLLGDPYPREREERLEWLVPLIGYTAGDKESFSMIPLWLQRRAGWRLRQAISQSMTVRFWLMGCGWKSINH